MVKQQAEIEVVRFPENVRQRHGVYIIDLNHMVEEIVMNSVDEAVIGNCDKIDVEIKDNQVTVSDNGSGIPIAPSNDPEFKGVPQVEVALTTLHAGGKYSDKVYQSTGGLNGIGSSAVNALSESFSCIVKNDGHKYRCDYEKGITKKHLYKLKDKVPKEDTGTTIVFVPDSEIWESDWFRFKDIERRCRQLAYLNPGLKINLKIDSIDDEENEVKAEHHFCYDNGLHGYVERLTKGKSIVGNNIVELVKESKPIPVSSDNTDENELVEDNSPGISIAMAWTDSYSFDIKSFVNNVRTVYGGDHETGFKEGLVKAVKKYALENNFVKDQKQIETGDCLEGLTVVLSTRIKDPVYEGQGKGKLKMSAVRSSIRESVDEFLYDFLSKDSKRAKEIIEKVLKAGKARLAAKRARDAARGIKEISNSGGLPGKLADCITKDPSLAEIMLVEGDSAGGSAKEGRDPVTQAILPIFGKILNADKARLDRVLASTKMADIITAFGCGIGDDFDISKLRYHKIIIMADKDEDGRHIVILHLTFLYRYMRPLIEAGYVYVANSPFYRLTKGKGKKIERKYALDERALAKMNTDGWTITRIKGLGELRPSELWDTTMNPETRTLTRITIEDAEAAESMLSLCMGDAVEPRRQFIFEQLAS